MIEIIVAIIAIIPTTLAVILSNRKTNQKLDENQRISNRNDAKQAILQMMTEDKVCYLFGHLPENYLRIHEEYDRYRDNGGNSYMEKKVKQYDAWYEGVESKIQYKVKE